MGKMIKILFIIFTINTSAAFAEVGCNIGTTVYTSQSGTGTYGGTTVPNFLSSGDSYSLGNGLTGCHAEETGYASVYGGCVIDNNSSTLGRHITINIINCNLDDNIYFLLISITFLALLFIQRVGMVQSVNKYP